MKYRKGAGGGINGIQVARFDFTNPSTYDSPFHRESLSGKLIEAIYLALPDSENPITPVNALIDHAIKKHGFNRFVLLAGATAMKGGPGWGKVWEHLDQVGARYTILRMTWFMGESTSCIHG